MVLTHALGWPASFCCSSVGLHSAVRTAGCTRGNTYLPFAAPAANVPEVITVAASNVANKYNGTKAGEQKGEYVGCLGVARVEWGACRVGSRRQAGGMERTRGSEPRLGAGAQLPGSNACCALQATLKTSTSGPTPGPAWTSLRR